MADIAAGEIPAGLQQAIEEGRLTQEQVEEMMEQGHLPVSHKRGWDSREELAVRHKVNCLL